MNSQPGCYKAENIPNYFYHFLYRSFVAQWLRRRPCNNQVVSSNLTGVLFLFFTGFFKNCEKYCRRYLKNMQLIISFPFTCTRAALILIKKTDFFFAKNRQRNKVGKNVSRNLPKKKQNSAK